MKSKGINENNDNKNNNNNQTENKEPETENKIKREIDIQNNMDRPETKDDLNADIKIEDLQAPVKRRHTNIYKPKKTPFETKKDIVIYNTTDEINDKIEEKENKKEEDNLNIEEEEKNKNLLNYDYEKNNDLNNSSIKDDNNHYKALDNDCRKESYHSFYENNFSFQRNDTGYFGEKNNERNSENRESKYYQDENFLKKDMFLKQNNLIFM